MVTSIISPDLQVIYSFNPSIGLIGVVTLIRRRVLDRDNGFNPSIGLIGVVTPIVVLCRGWQIGFNPSIGLIGVVTGTR